jgi:hypothetical protein
MPVELPPLSPTASAMLRCGAATPQADDDPADADADALALWVEHSARHAARAAALHASVAVARAAALERLAALPPLPPLGGGGGGSSGRLGTFEVGGTVGVGVPRERAMLRAMRKRRREAIMREEMARREAAVARAREDERVQREEEEQVRAREEAQVWAEAQRSAAEEEAARRVEEAERRRRDEEASAAEAERRRIEEEALKQTREKESAAKAVKVVATVEPLPPHVVEAGAICAQDPAMKKPRLLLKKRVNRAVNQIAVSVKAVCASVGSLVGAMGEAAGSGIPTALSYTMKEIAERLVAEGHLSVAVSAPAAFAVGAVIVGVVAHAADPARMRLVVLAAYFDKCAYIIPTYVQRSPGEATESFRARLGYKPDEKPDAYVERMCGYVSSYAAVVQTVEVYGPGGRTTMQNPFPREDAWGWLARIVNGPQRGVTPDIVCAFLDIAGFELARMYGAHFRALLASVRDVCVNHAAKNSRPGARSRIVGYVEDYERSGGRILEAPSGKVLPVRDSENRVE